LAVDLPQRAYTHDFSAFYAEAIAFRHSLDPYTTNLTPIGQPLGLHIGSLIHATDTPTALLLFIPFSFVTPSVAHTIWIALNAGALTAALILLLWPKYSGLSVRVGCAIGAIALLYQPITDNFIFGQRQTLILLLLVLVMRALDEGREAAAGLLFGLAVAYRAFPALISGYFVVRRQWRPLIFIGVALAIIGVVTVAGLGIPVCAGYLHGMNFAVSAFRLDPADVSLRGFTIRLFSYVAGLQPNTRIQILQRITITSGEIVIVGLAAWPTYQRRQRVGLDRRAYALWIAAAIILSPLSWIHYMILLLIPFVEIASAAERQKCSRREVWAAIASYVLIAMTYPLREDLVGVTAWVHGVRYLAEGPSVSLLVGFLAAYWFATDTSDSPDAETLRKTPPGFATSDLSPAQIVSLRAEKV
jgi:hypothetical protein